VFNLLKYFPSNIKNKISSHSVVVILPLTVITVFCFSYVLMQPAQNLNQGSAASKRPSLLTGKAVPEIQSTQLTQDQKLTTDDTAQLGAPATANSTGSTPVTTSPQTPKTANPQAASPSPATGNYSKSNTSSGLPPLTVTKSVTQVLNNIHL
jgi:hypothetical protein